MFMKISGILCLASCPFFFVEILVSTLFYTGWIHMMDWGLSRLADYSDTGRVSEFKLSNQLLTLIPAVLLAIVFNWILIFTWGLMESFWRDIPMTFSYNPSQRMILSTRYRANQALTILALISGYYLCVSSRIQDNLNKALVDSQRMEKENINTQFLALKNQISPHFLFNNLNALITLIPKDPELSIQFVQKLSAVYRQVLNDNEKNVVSLESELSFLKDYVFLYQIRFGQKLQVDFDIQQDLYGLKVIPMALQMLLENAIKHNVISSEDKLFIRVNALEGYVTVINNKQKKTSGVVSTNTGLINIQNRYKALTEKPVKILETRDQFSVSIPLLN